VARASGGRHDAALRETEQALSGQAQACWWIVLRGAEKLDDTIRYSVGQTAAKLPDYRAVPVT